MLLKHTQTFLYNWSDKLNQVYTQISDTQKVVVGVDVIIHDVSQSKIYRVQTTIDQICFDSEKSFHTLVLDRGSLDEKADRRLKYRRIDVERKKVDCCVNGRRFLKFLTSQSVLEPE